MDPKGITSNKLPEIRGRMESLSKQITELSEAIAFLDTKLEPVTRQEAGSNETGRPATPSSTSMSQTLQEMIERIEYQIEKVKNISERLEI